MDYKGKQKASVPENNTSSVNNVPSEPEAQSVQSVQSTENETVTSSIANPLPPEQQGGQNNV